MLLTARRASLAGVLLVWLRAASAAPGALAAGGPDLGREEAPAPGVRGDAGAGAVTSQLGLYYQGDPDGDHGNPFVDETLTVIEPAVLLDYNATDRLAATVSVSYDHLSSASLDRIPGRSETWGASDYFVGGDLALRYWTTDEFQVGAHAGYSAESDYRSLGLGGSAALSRADQNATVALSADAFLDEVEVVRFDGSKEGWSRRTSVSATASWYQVLSPAMHGEFGATVTHQYGFLETPFNPVVIEDPGLPPNPELENRARGEVVTEELPGTRTRGAVFGRVRRSVRTGTALELGGRLYADTWGIRSVALEPRLYQTLLGPALRLRVRYRYYVQTESKYFEDRFTRAESFRTQDSDLGDLDSHTAGAKITWDLGETHTVALAADYVLRSDDLNQSFYALSWVRRF